MDIVDLQKRLQALYNKAEEVYENEARAKIAFISLKNQEKNQLASFMLSAPNGSQIERERQIRASHEWIQWSKGMDLAENQLIQAQAKVSAYEAKLKILQSLNKKFDLNS